VSPETRANDANENQFRLDKYNKNSLFQILLKLIVLFIPFNRSNSV